MDEDGVVRSLHVISSAQSLCAHAVTQLSLQQAPVLTLHGLVGLVGQLELLNPCC